MMFKSVDNLIKFMLLDFPVEILKTQACKKLYPPSYFVTDNVSFRKTPFLRNDSNRFFLFLYAF